MVFSKFPLVSLGSQDAFDRNAKSQRVDFIFKEFMPIPLALLVLYSIRGGY